ncbi:hypothetical protein DUY81_14035 [Acidipropionibacterium acidipropionici]|uniref:Uncharacterized protein n=1 Tax=Acidipropionibacterium acidipropionici TaxID=1748 RepID=A0AAC8YGV5_9ACTN|nr:hypothetical protein [Acidipropionibacterium acidipropionici]AMS06451.1 hypothetical protein AXH35_14330 [Acidipropionibacterium acidipropionici]AOZ47899.1 hypothetical protein A8L58_15790 [Acidipropionibacterium acidipropionici]AZP38755.1 hypothetical protein DUY81_14035 [Acidipropionibacterium acidipropionici]
MSCDIASLLIDVLPGKLDCPVDTEIPDPRPDGRFVRVVDAGGPAIRDWVLDEVQVTWEASSTVSPADAALLALTVRDAFDSLAGTEQDGQWICDVTCTRPRWFPDENRIPRYTGSAIILMQNP